MERTLAKDVKEHIGGQVLLKGWVHALRVMGKLNFIVLRDRTGTVQTKIKGYDNSDGSLKEEASIKILGAVVTDERAPNGFEVDIEKLEVISTTFDTPPIQVNRSREQIGTRLETLLSHRPLSLRNPEIGGVFKIRAEIIWGFREFLKSQGFLEVQTPKIVAAGTEGGTALFAVQYFEQKAYLAQSPQFYKQMLVGSGYERVCEVGAVYRAEEHNTTRHLNEYISLDYEMGFIEDFHEITTMETELLRFIFANLEKSCARELELYKIEVPKVPSEIPHMKLSEAGDILKKNFKKNMNGDIDPEGEQLICKYVKEKTGSDFLFMTHYPTENRPMYAFPCEDDPKLTNSFDLLFRGLEITSGGQRIHDYEQLTSSIRGRGLNPADFDFYLEIFKYGMPPHGGLAIGAERLTCQLLNLANVREASFFPRDRNRIVP
ncbi:aspartate--tRNA(Asn) ligase [Candidatus Acetothermia bacterium]|nr:aspartate--tRNA(Asn) ligase [Candidatus Acetothermia bacterium]MBI3644223.1 aspartate--tRNA(Asn) ligase [Candidatus Acetothermia bacterium]